MVGGAENVGVVLDDEDGVAQVAQLFEDVDKAGGVARVEADGRLVEDIERADQSRAERGGELDALRLAAGERGGKAVEGEVFQADGVEEAEALADFVEDGAGDLFMHGREAERIEEFLGLGDGERGGLADVLAVEADAAGLGPQTLAAAIGTLGVAAILAEHDAHVQLIFLALHLRKEAVDAGKGALAAQDDFARRFRQVAPGHVQRNTQLRRVLAEFGKPGAVLGAVPRIDGAAVQAEILVGDDQVQVEVHGVAKALAAGTGAEGIVKTE